MDTTITIAVLGALISIIGWIVNYILSTSAERHRQKLLTQIEFTKQQLEELYGPLVFLVVEGKYSFSEAIDLIDLEHKLLQRNAQVQINGNVNDSGLASMQDDKVIDQDMAALEYKSMRRNAQIQMSRNIKDSKLVSGQDDKVWEYWIENEFFPRNEKIRELIANKTHLIEGEKMPQSWLGFIEHYNSWKVNFDRWQKGLAKYPLYSKTGWPQDFDDDILSTFESLKKRQSYLMGMMWKEKIPSS
jgi:hypothetical protein